MRGNLTFLPPFSLPLSFRMQVIPISGIPGVPFDSLSRMRGVIPPLFALRPDYSSFPHAGDPPSEFSVELFTSLSRMRGDPVGIKLPAWAERSFPHARGDPVLQLDSSHSQQSFPHT